MATINDVAIEEAWRIMNPVGNRAKDMRTLVLAGFSLGVSNPIHKCTDHKNCVAWLRRQRARIDALGVVQ